MIRLATLRRARAAQVDRLLAHPNVIGTGLGIKRRHGEQTASSALVVYVRRKVPDDALSAGERVPPRITFSNQAIPTDVVEVPGMRTEAPDPIYYLSDGQLMGAVSAFAIADGLPTVVTCAHCLLGRDGNPYTSEPINLWDTLGGRFTPAGENGFAVNAPGLGLRGNFGFTDAGLVMIKHPHLQKRIRSAPPLRFASRLVRGMSVIAQTPRATLAGSVDAVEAVINGVRVDIMVHMPHRGTVRGNSGLLWRTSDGAAVGMHAIGIYEANAEESRYSICMSAARVAALLHVQLLDPERLREA